MKKITNCLLILMLLLASCEKNQSDVVDVDMDISVINSLGQDLLGTVYTKDNIKMSHLIDGKETPYVNNQADGIFKENLHFLKVFPGNLKEPNITLIKFGDLTTDTIKREFTRECGSIFLTKIWYNGILKFDDSQRTNSKRKYFTIIK